MKSLSPLLAPLLLSLAGCTVTAVSQQDDPRPNNFCQSDADCGNSHCSEGLCQALNGQIESLLVTVTPPSDSLAPHFTFVTNVEDVPTSGGQRDLRLPGPSHLSGSLQLPQNFGCYPTFVNEDLAHTHVKAADVSLPVNVIFSLKQRLLGLPQQIYVAQTPDDPVKGHYAFDVHVPAGEYDIYFVPPRQEPSCSIPPQLVRSKTIDAGSFEIPFLVAPIATLNLAIHWPKTSTSLKGWVADIIEPLGGNPISTQVVLGDPIDPGELNSNFEYAVKLAYSPVVEPPSSPVAVEAAHELFRLRPPAGLVAPTIFYDRTALTLIQDPPRIELSSFTRFPAAVTVHGQLARLDDATPVSGVVSLVSTAVAGVDAGIFASFQTTVEVGPDGKLDVVLPPGSYRVQAMPPVADGIPPVAGALSALEATWLIPADVPDQAGKLLELPVLAEVTGQARVQGASLEAVPSPQTVLPFEQAFGGGLFSPRATSGLVNEAGRFAVQVDPGQFDISLQAPESLGFGWFVRPGVEIAQKDLDLGRVGLPTPSLFSGTVSVDLGGTPLAVSSASIRAYAYLNAARVYTRDPSEAVSVVEVAATRANDDGTFRLLVPSSIAAQR